MKTKRTLKFLKSLKPGSPFEIRRMDASPEKGIADLVRSVMDFGRSAHRTQGAGTQGGEDTSVPMEYLKALVSIATNAWRAKSKTIDATTGEVREEMKRVGRHIEAIYRNLAEVGVAIRDHTGDAYDEGQPMKVVASKPTPGLEKKRVSETLLPSIFLNNRLVQNGEIEIATPGSPDASGEALPHQP